MFLSSEEHSAPNLFRGTLGLSLEPTLCFVGMPTRLGTWRMNSGSQKQSYLFSICRQSFCGAFCILSFFPPVCPDIYDALARQPEAQRVKSSIPATQYGHNRCFFFGLKHAGHSTTCVTSFSAFPANCRCRFFMCEVFFLGTARSTPSQMSDIMSGMFSVMDGIVMEALGSIDDQADEDIRVTQMAAKEEVRRFRGSSPRMLPSRAPRGMANAMIATGSINSHQRRCHRAASSRRSTRGGSCYS